MLFNGERVGNGRGPACDIAVDPIDGTSLTAAGRQNALSVIAVSDRGTMLDASSVFYMDKIVTDAAGIGVVDIRKPIGENLRALAAAKGKDVGEMRVAVLNRPRHEQLIADIREAGAGTRLISDGDVAGGINAASVRVAHRHVRRHRRQPRGHHHRLRDQGARRVHAGSARAEGRRRARARRSGRPRLRPRLRARATWCAATTRSSSPPA